jgi:two-component system nitrogen regulation response regulator GlnG
MMILLVDNDEDFRHGLAENLRDDGHQVLEFSRPGDLPPLAQLGAVELAVTDYLMEGGENGLAFAHRFHGARPKVPVVLLTAYSTAQIEAAAARSGFISLLHKPLDYGQLQRIISRLVASSVF